MFAVEKGAFEAPSNEPDLVVPVCSPDHLNTVRKGHKRGRWEIEIYVRKEVDSRTIVCSIAGGYLCVVVVIFRCCLYPPFLLRTALIQLPSLRLLLLSLIDDAAALLFFSDVATCPNGCELFQVLCCTGSFRLFGLASRFPRLLFMPSSASLLNSTYCFVTGRRRHTEAFAWRADCPHGLFRCNYVIQALVSPRAKHLLQAPGETLGRLLSINLRGCTRAKVEREVRQLQRKPVFMEKLQRRFRARNVPQHGQG